MALGLCSGVYGFEVAFEFLENMWTPGVFYP
jgi:hypothetical protein